MVSRVGAYALIMVVMTLLLDLTFIIHHVMMLLFDLTFIMQILSETGVKGTFEIGLTIIPVPAIHLFL